MYKIAYYCHKVLKTKSLMWIVEFLLVLCLQARVVITSKVHDLHNSTERLIIPARQTPRKHLTPIKNLHGFTNVCDRLRCGDFHLVIYRLSLRSCQVTIRRLDSLDWSYNVSIFIKAQKSPEVKVARREVFNIGSSVSHVKTVTLDTTIDLFADPNHQRPQLIPKVIIQTYSTRTAESVYQWQAHLTFTDLNPEYTLKMFTDRDCRQFLRKYFSTELLQAYDVLVSATFKADLFRYAYLALRGGCYFDHKMILRQPLRSVILPKDKLLLCLDALPASGRAVVSVNEVKRLYNAIICAQRQDPRMYLVIDHVLSNIKQRKNAGSDLSLTGPVAFYEALHGHVNESEIRFKHGFRKRSISPIGRKYEDYFVQEKLHNSYFTTKYYKGYKTDIHTRYGYLWRTGQIYYDLLGMFGSWKVYLYPTPSHHAETLHTVSKPVVSVKDCLQEVKFEENDKQQVFLTLSFDSKNTTNECVEVRNSVQKIKLLVINDDSSDQYTIEVPLDEGYHHHHSNKGQAEGEMRKKEEGKKYVIPFMFNSHPPQAVKGNVHY